MMCIDCHERPIHARGRCTRCYPAAAARGVIQIKHYKGATCCQAPGCTMTGLFRRGFCPMHYTRLYRHGDVADRRPVQCQAPGCERRGKLTRGMCVMHYARWWREQKQKLGV